MKKLLIFLTILTMSANMFSMKTFPIESIDYPNRTDSKIVKLREKNKLNFLKTTLSLLDKGFELYDKPEIEGRHANRHYESNYYKRINLIRCNFNDPMRTIDSYKKFKLGKDAYITGFYLFPEKKELIFLDSYTASNRSPHDKNTIVVFNAKDFRNKKFQPILLQILTKIKQETKNKKIKKALTDFINFLIKAKKKTLDLSKSGILTDMTVITEN